MKRIVLNNLVIAVLAVSAACTSNKIDDVEYGENLLKINEQYFPIVGAILCLRKIPDGTEYIASISFEGGIGGRSLLILSMNTTDEKLKAKTYTANEIENLRIHAMTVDGSVFANYYYYDSNVVMKVDIKCKTYYITITGHVTMDENEIESEYTATYKGEIEVSICL